MAKPEEILRAIADTIGNSEKEKHKVVETFPFKKEWQPLLDKWNEEKDKAIKMYNELEEQKRKFSFAKSKFFLQVEEDLKLYHKNLGYNDKANEIDLYESANGEM